MIENEVLDKILKDFRTPFDLEKGFPFYKYGL